MITICLRAIEYDGWCPIHNDDRCCLECEMRNKCNHHCKETDNIDCSAEAKELSQKR